LAAHERAGFTSVSMPSNTCDVQSSMASCELASCRKSSQFGQPSRRNLACGCTTEQHMHARRLRCVVVVVVVVVVAVVDAPADAPPPAPAARPGMMGLFFFFYDKNLFFLFLLFFYFFLSCASAFFSDTFFLWFRYMILVAGE
jgi:hypothetical protein